MISALALTAILFAQFGDPPAMTAPPGMATMTAPPSGQAMVAEAPPPAMVAEVPPGGVMAGSPYMTRDEVQAEMKKWSWSKGDFRFVPYGILWGNAAWDSQRTRIGEYALWVDSPSVHPGESDAQIDAKSTRIGIDMTGPPIGGCLGDCKIGGKIEVDFQGYFTIREKPGLLLRHAYVEAKDDEQRFLVGQTWDVISPLYMPVLNYTAGSGVGNLAYRRAQFRYERYLACSDTVLFTLQGALAANSVTDYVTDSTVSADIGPYPDIQGRAAITLGRRNDPTLAPITFGVSGHIGEQDFDFRTAPIESHIRRPTWSLDADLYVPITSRFGFQAEFFTGENLSNYMGGILQGVDRITHQGIYATGGFCDIWFDWRPDLHSHWGYAIDDPVDSDLTAGRTYNHMLYTNMLYDATKNLQLGIEVSSWKTLYVGLLPGNAIRVETAVKYKF